MTQEELTHQDVVCNDGSKMPSIPTPTKDELETPSTTTNLDTVCNGRSSDVAPHRKCAKIIEGILKCNEKIYKGVEMETNK